ncbi:MAG TPA: hypothetical protein VK638_00645 [Edaphobacter sp.]|nr:hypothetical protein [Edaphobacter sp.]
MSAGIGAGFFYPDTPLNESGADQAPEVVTAVHESQQEALGSDSAPSGSEAAADQKHSEAE